MPDLAKGYKTPSDVWQAVVTNSSNIVWSLSSVNFNGPPTGSRTPAAGDRLQLFYKPSSGPTLSKNVTVAGVMNGVFFGGIVTTTGLLNNSFITGTGNLGFLKVSSWGDPTPVSITLKKDFARLGMHPLAISAFIPPSVQIYQSSLALFEPFLALDP